MSTTERPPEWREPPLTIERPGEETLELTMRLAVQADVPGIRALLADDELGATREDLSEGALARYESAFAAIEDDPKNELWAAVSSSLEHVIGMYQVTYIPYLSRGGNERALIEAVRVSSGFRDLGVGGWMMRGALRRAQARGCLLAQLTTDKTRHAAHRFYEGLGFTASHEGMKLHLATWSGADS